MIIARRIAAGFALAAAPVVILLGAGAANAQTIPVNPGPSVSHPAFPHQDNVPQPGTAVHHHHQNNHAR